MKRYAVYERSLLSSYQQTMDRCEPYEETDDWEDAYWAVYDIASFGLRCFVVDRETGRITDGDEVEKEN